MQERTSQTLLLVEAILLLAPVTLLTVFYSFALLAMYGGGLSSEPLAAHAAAVFTFLGLALQLCGWRIVIGFVRKGRRGIAAISTTYFYIAGVGAALVLVSLFVLFLSSTGLELPAYASVFTVNYAGLPALVPFCHVLAERALLARRYFGTTAQEELSPRTANDDYGTVANAAAPRMSMEAIKAASLVALGGTAILTITSGFSGMSLSAMLLAGLVLGAVSTFVFMFFIALLPLPAAVLCRKYLPNLPAPAALALSCAIGLLMVFAILWLIETPPVETDGDTTIYRHAGPTLNASEKISYYLWTLPIMVTSLVSFHWLSRKRIESE